MDRKLARTNMRMGIIMFIGLMLLLGATFLWATVYLNVVN